ncbi:glutathione S-transferase family protein [Lichenibacterium minor]|uniref:Glutathione S-transferase family protein n=1 Tax=Lichenibacterium minor TaxID=2316528 RepID=A0A4V1RUY4_9HYPH|nr:glutathione S-transferase family protein [Lichenibacterium minor]RYC32764.1 glutathione S-transferase family protein [Lichenibacterium minor]
MPTIKLWGFNNSTYVRTVKMLLAEKGVTDFEQVPVNVLKGEPKSPEHLERHPFGKVPVVDVDGFRVIETPAIAAYLDAVLPGRKVVPAEPKSMARAAMTVSIIDSYGYMPLIGGVVAYHLFPDFVGGKNEEMHHKGIADGKAVIAELMKIRGSDRFIAGAEPSLADLYLAPIFAYVVLTPHKDEFLALPGVSAWWDAVTALESFKSTEY